MSRCPTEGSERATLQGALRAVKTRLGVAVLVGLGEKPYGNGWANQCLARLSATEQLQLFNEAVVSIDKPREKITTTDILSALGCLLLHRCFDDVPP